MSAGDVESPFLPEHEVELRFIAQFMEPFCGPIDVETLDEAGRNELVAAFQAKIALLPNTGQALQPPSTNSRSRSWSEPIPHLRFPSSWNDALPSDAITESYEVDEMGDDIERLVVSRAPAPTPLRATFAHEDADNDFAQVYQRSPAAPVTTFSESDLFCQLTDEYLHFSGSELDGCLDMDHDTVSAEMAAEASLDSPFLSQSEVDVATFARNNDQ
jgi:hypothetical protein